MSLGIAAPYDQPEHLDPVSVATDARHCLQVVKDLHRERGWLRWDNWLLLAAGADSPARSWNYPNGVVDEAVWDGACAEIGSLFDHLHLGSGSWGELHIGAPELRFHGADVASIAMMVECPAAAVEPTVAAFLDFLEQHHGTAAFVHVDSIADPFTEIVCGNKLAADDFTTQIHGYYWAVYLGPGQIARLGGKDAVTGSAPCASITELGDGLLCRLTESPLDQTPDAVRAWRAFLLPLLREGYPESSDMVGAPLTPLARPVWLFEGVPVDPDLRLVLLEGYRPPHLEPRCSAAVQGELDPARVVVTVAPAEGEPPDSFADEAGATLNAWYQTARAGKLHSVAGRAGESRAVESDGQSDGVVIWTIDLGTIDPLEAGASLERAFATLSTPVARLTLSGRVGGASGDIRPS